MTGLLLPERRILRPTDDECRRLRATNMRGITSPYRHRIGSAVAATMGGAGGAIDRGLWEVLRDGTAAGLSMNAASAWNFSQSSGDYLDQSAAGNNNPLTFISGHTRLNWTGPDGTQRSTASNGAAYQAAASGISTAAGFSIVFAAQPSTGNTSGIFKGPYSGTAQISNLAYDNNTNTWVLTLGRTTGATHSQDSWAQADPNVLGVHIVVIPDSTTPTPVWRYNGAVMTLTRSTGPNGLMQRGAMGNFRGFYANSTYYGRLGPMAIFNGPLTGGDITIIEAAATGQGWF